MADQQVSRYFGLLDPRVQRRVYELGWEELRCSQEEAIAPILAGCDVIISAPTAGGKTEAAILPVASLLLAPENLGATALCISPLKALINDQHERLQLFCGPLGIEVHAWHGDVAASRKRRTFERPAGFVLITPEALEAMFVRRGAVISRAFARLKWIIVDELHSFWGQARGKQLQALMARLEEAVGGRVPRIALSATLGDLALAAEFLRPQGGDQVQLIRSRFPDRDMEISVYGYRPSERARVVDALLQLRGSNNLVFANSRGDVEQYTDLLRRRSEMAGVADEFVPHHAGISKRSREITEARLKAHSQPITAVCTSTLELGMDLGELKEVAQIGPPRSVGSAMQRLGRSGRRGNAAVMKLHIIEPDITPATTVSGALHEDLIQTIAIVDLGLAGWCEPPQLGGLHLSTLVQQILSVAAQTGGVSAARTWRTLVEQGPFKAVGAEIFKAVLRSMAERDLITQGADGNLSLGATGEKVTRHFTCCAAFNTPPEYRLVHNGKTLGSLSLLPAPKIGQFLVFAGQCWRVIDVQFRPRRVSLVPAPDADTWPAREMHGDLADRVRQQMFKVYTENSERPYLDGVAREMLEAARRQFGEYGLLSRPFLPTETGVLLFTWRGDAVNETLALWLRHLGLDAGAHRMYVRVRAPETTLMGALAAISAECVDPIELASLATKKPCEKFDRFLNERLLNLEFASRYLDLDGARQVACACMEG